MVAVLGDQQLAAMLCDEAFSPLAGRDDGDVGGEVLEDLEPGAPSVQPPARYNPGLIWYNAGLQT